MTSNLYKAAEQFMIDSLTAANNEKDNLHHQLTVKWIKELKPDADDALLIAGLLHDIERAFYGDWKAGSSDADKITRHQELSASVAEKFLGEQGADMSFIDEVKDLILHHEEGGTAEQNILNDADCLALFEEKMLRFVKKWKKQGKTADEIREKVDYIYNRISSEAAIKIAEPWYKEALKEIN